MKSNSSIEKKKAIVSVFLYSNQPVTKCQGRYFTKMKNFVDFLALLSSKSPDYRLIVPCNSIEQSETAALIPINLPSDLIEVNSYQGHTQALLRTIPNAYHLRKQIKKTLADGHSVIIAGPGPNSMLYLLSLLLPKNVKFAFFIRGDTVKTVENMYKGRLIGRFAIELVKIFQRRIYSLLKQRRAIAFTYGTKLRDIYAQHGKAQSIAPLIDSSDISTITTVSREAHVGGILKVLFVGRLSREKGIQDLLDACQLAVKDGNPFELTIIGHGPLLDSLKDYIQTHELNRWVSLIGYVPHGGKLMTYFDSHDLLCLPSYTEGVPRVIVEAFARGLYVAATPVGSIPALFSEHLHLIENNSPRAILDAINWCRSHTPEIKDAAADLPEVANLYTLEHHVESVKKQLNQFAVADR